MSDSDTTNNSTPQHQPPPAAGGEHLRLAFEAWWLGSAAYLPEAMCASMSTADRATVRRLCWLAWLEGQSHGIAQAQAIYAPPPPLSADELAHAAKAHNDAKVQRLLDRAMRPL